MSSQKAPLPLLLWEGIKGEGDCPNLFPVKSLTGGRQFNAPQGKAGTDGTGAPSMDKAL